MKIKKEKQFSPITIVLESLDEAVELLQDLQDAEGFMINEGSEPIRSRLNDTSRILSDSLDEMT